MVAMSLGATSDYDLSAWIPAMPPVCKSEPPRFRLGLFATWWWLTRGVCSYFRARLACEEGVEAD